ncbi:hypothetical protein M885DRAFT_193267 [Pelagophyceae sp. CCMP2097]|nr:hypothetical protein M885DRAFT_193267 [Pelagophyceae sp. CCMP2097]
MVGLRGLFFACLSCAAGEAQEHEVYSEAYALGIVCARKADLACARTSFLKSVRGAQSGAEAARANHALATLALIRGDAAASVSYRAAAKASDSSAVPPLAELQMHGDSCSGLGDVYWMCAFAIRRLHEEPNPNTLSALRTTVEAHTALGILLADSGAFLEAEANFEAAYVLEPSAELQFRRALSVPAVLAANAAAVEAPLAIRRRVRELVAANVSISKLDQLSMPGTFYIVYLGGADAQLMTDIQNAYYNAYPALRQNKAEVDKVRGGMAYATRVVEEQGVSSSTGFSNGLTRNGLTRLKVGFVSSYFHRHSVCKLLCGVIRHLAEKEDMDVIIFSASKEEDDFTLYASTNSTTIRLQRGTIIANRALAAGLDILVFADLGMETAVFSWACARLAPVQILFWGHPHTSGLGNTIDYFVSNDDFEPRLPSLMPETYAEQVVRFDSLSFYFRHPKEAGYAFIPRDSDKTALKNKLKLQAFDVLFLVPQTLPKFHPSFDAVLIDLVVRSNAEQSKAAVVITYDETKALWLHVLQRRLFAKLALRGAAHLTHRFIFVPQLKGPDFFTLNAIATLLLDPFPFGGGVTTLEAFSVCKAVITAPALQSVPRLTFGADSPSVRIRSKSTHAAASRFAPLRHLPLLTPRRRHVRAHGPGARGCRRGGRGGVRSAGSRALARR